MSTSKTKKMPKSKPSKNTKPKGNFPHSTIVEAPTAFGQRQGFVMRNEQGKSRRIQNSELIASVNGSASFAVTKYSMNPGLPVFAWLSKQAQYWQQYRFHKLVIRFVTRTSTDTKGSIIISPDYNAADNVPASETEASNTQDAVEDVVWRSLSSSLDVKAMFPYGPRKMVRSGTLNPSSDVTVYDACRLFICTIGEADSSQIGKLWVDYDVELFVPQSTSVAQTFTVAYSSYYQRATATIVSSGLVAATNFQFDPAIYDPLGIGTQDGNKEFQPPAGYYRITLNLTGALSNGSLVNFTAYFEIRKNGAIAVPYISQVLKISAAPTAPPSIGLSGDGIISCNGTDKFSVWCYMIDGTAVPGVCTWNGGQNSLLITQA